MTTLESTKSVERIDGPFISNMHNKSANNKYNKSPTSFVIQNHHNNMMTNSGSTFSLVFSDEPRPKKMKM
jgi:hypothetical protein